ncbi:AGAP000624-PA-like protein [Anopheles sinensis]|uniref:AGAP000624-PA-like protein n=1 Tax=Anopheles sinensis TaxID=74873 RepID=A0A084WF33_ANOSI|nr:AGAP000624-PA-like protein [Anopheles sinensis]
MPPEPKETKRAPDAPTTDVPSSDTEQATDASDASADEELDELGELDPSSAEFHSINESLDSLSSALDIIEQKNDSLREQLLLLLQSQRETLKSFKEENGRNDDCDAGEQPTGTPGTRQPPAIEPMEQS